MRHIGQGPDTHHPEARRSLQARPLREARIGERHSQLLGLHGHIHESKGFVKIGRTLYLNPGNEYSDGVLRGALVNLDGSKVKEFMVTSG